MALGVGHDVVAVDLELAVRGADEQEGAAGVEHGEERQGLVGLAEADAITRTHGRDWWAQGFYRCGPLRAA